MFYFRIKEFCNILCIFGKTWLYIVLHDFNLPYYSSIILDSFSILLFQKLCWHIGLTPNYHQKRYLQPAVISVWGTEQSALLAQCRAAETPLIIGGDGRADSPGHSAKYGSYGIIELITNKIIDMQLVQVIASYIV